MLPAMHTRHHPQGGSRNHRRPLLRWAGALAVGGMVMTLASAALAQGYRGPTRVNFDERLIKGQTAKAGSVYIFDRQQSEIRSLVNRKRLFKHKIIRTVFEE